MSLSLLLGASPLDGHMAPMLTIAEHFVRRGHRVRFFAGDDYADAVARTGAEHLPWPADAHVDHLAVIAEATAAEGKRNTGVARFGRNIIREYLSTTAGQYRALQAAIAAEHTDAVIVEPMVTGVLALLMQREPRPRVVTCGIFPMMVPSVDTAPSLLPRPGRLGRLRNRAIWWVAQHVLLREPQRVSERVLFDLTGARLDRFFMNYGGLADAQVQLTVPGFEYPRSDLAPNLTFVGPLLGASPRGVALPDWWDDLRGRIVVHVAQGTVADADPEELILPTIRGLAGRDVLVVVATGRAPVSSLGALRSNVRVAEFIPYDLLMPVTDVFVTNGGYGGLHYALAHGVPIVVAGDTEDKVETSNRVQWSGVGINLHGGHPTPAAIAAAVDDVLRSPDCRARVRAMQTEIAAAPGVIGVEQIVSDLVRAMPAGIAS